MWSRKGCGHKKDVVKEKMCPRKRCGQEKVWPRKGVVKKRCKRCGQEMVWSRKGVKDVVKKWCGQEKDVVIKKDVHKAKE